MKFKVTLSIGLVGGRHDEIEIPDEDLEGLDNEQREKLINEYWSDWAWNYIDGGATPVE